MLTSLRLEGIRDVISFSKHLSREYTASLAARAYDWCDFKGNAGFTEVRNKPAAVMESHHRAREGASINLEKLSIATHFKNLITWSPEASTTLVLGEKSSGGLEDHCVLRIVNDPKSKTHILTIHGEGFEKRAARIEQLVGLLRSHRRIYKLHGWKMQHRDCITDSPLLAAEQLQHETSVLFHTPEDRVIAECVSLSSKLMRDFSNFLANLIPR
jgi:hypothetical protein